MITQEEAMKRDIEINKLRMDIVNIIEKYLDGSMVTNADVISILELIKFEACNKIFSDALRASFIPR